MNRAAFVAVALAAMLTAAPSALAQRSPHDITTYGVVVSEPGMKTAVSRAGLVYDGELKADVTYPSNPAGKTWPAVVFVNGVGAKINEWEIYKTWAQLVAAHGMVGIVAEAAPGKAAENHVALMRWIEREGPKMSIDTSRVGIWACSANVTVALPYLMQSAPPSVKAAVLYYGNGPASKLRRDLPILYVLAGRDGAGLNAGIRAIWADAIRDGVPWTMVSAPELTHAFDALDEREVSRRLVRDTVAYLEQRLAVQPSDPPVAPARQGLTHVYGSEPAEAAAIYKGIVAKDPGDAGAVRALGIALVRSGKPAEALPHLEKAVAAGEGGWPLLLSLGQAQSATGDYPAAMASYRKAVEKGAPPRRVWGGIGVDLLQAKQYEAAIQAYEKAFAAGIPEGPDATGIAAYNLACAYALAGKKAEALDRLDRAVTAGFGTRAEIERDEDLASLRGEPRFREILAKAKT